MSKTLLKEHLKKYLANAKARAVRDKVKFNLSLSYLESIVTDVCPIFGTPFVWGQSGLGKGNTRDNTPTLDRILPELGYIEGNVAFLSYRANRIKDNGTMQEHYDIADWIWERTKHVREKQSTSIPTGSASESKEQSQFGTIHGTGTGQDCDGSHHHRGESEGENTCDSTKEGCRICMGSGSKQVEALTTFKSREDYGISQGETKLIAKLLGCVCYQS